VNVGVVLVVTFPGSGSIAVFKGIVFVDAGVITVTLELCSLATYILFVTGFTATAKELVPDSTVVVELFVPSITVTSPIKLLQ